MESTPPLHPHISARRHDLSQIGASLHFSKLQDLSLDNVSMIMGEAEIAGFHLRDVIYGLPQLTGLQLINLTISGFPGALVPAKPACRLTNLRSLTASDCQKQVLKQPSVISIHPVQPRQPRVRLPQSVPKSCASKQPYDPSNPKFHLKDLGLGWPGIPNLGALKSNHLRI